MERHRELFRRLNQRGTNLLQRHCGLNVFGNQPASRTGQWR
jgi:hypothetical protein